MFLINIWYYILGAGPSDSWREQIPCTGYRSSDWRQYFFLHPSKQHSYGTYQEHIRQVWRSRSWYLRSACEISTTYGQCCGYRMIIPDPGSWFLPIPDPGSKNSNKREGWKKICSHTFFVATNFTKLKIILVLKCRRKNLGEFSKNYRTFYFLPKKLSLSSQKYGFGIRDPRSGIRDPRSGIRDKNLFRIPDPGVKKAPDPGSGSATLSLAIIFGSGYGTYISSWNWIGLTLLYPHWDWGYPVKIRIQEKCNYKNQFFTLTTDDIQPTTIDRQ